MREIPDVLRTAPFTLRQALRLGVSERMLRGRRFRQVIRGVYASVDLSLVLAGLPEPAVNPRIGTEHEPIGKMDLVYFEYKVIVEYDGDHHRTDRRQWATDIARHEAAAAAGWHTIRVTNERMRRPRRLVRGVYERLVARGYRGPAPNFSAEWCSLFE